MIKEKIIRVARRLIRSVEYENQLDTLFFFLNSYVDIRDIPKATGELRKLQKCDSKLLKIFDAICEKHGLTYWLDGGTMLGAYRHGGFIPWDDDMDVCMPREDYDKALSLLTEELGKYGIDVSEYEGRPSESMGIGYKHKKTGIWLDVYPYDIISGVSLDDGNKALLREKIRKYRKYYRKNKDKANRLDLAKERMEILSSIKAGEGTIYCHGPEFVYPKMLMYDENVVLPLKKLKFEDGQYWSPNDADNYLSQIYGKDYMSFPRSGVVHHGNEEGKLYQWASNNEIELEDIEQELDRIYDIIVTRE